MEAAATGPWECCGVLPRETSDPAQAAALAQRDGAAILNLPPTFAPTAAGCAELPCATWGAALLGFAAPTEVSIERIGGQEVGLELFQGHADRDRIVAEIRAGTRVADTWKSGDMNPCARP